MENIQPRQLPIQISPDEIEIINDIRRMDFGKVIVSIQNGVIVSKEVTIITKTNRNKNNNSSFNNNGNDSRNNNNYCK